MSRTFLKAPRFDHRSHSWNPIYLHSILSGYGMPRSRISRSNPRQMLSQVKGARKALYSQEGLQVWKVLYKTLSSAFTVYFRFYTCLIVAVKLHHDSFKFSFYLDKIQQHNSELLQYKLLQNPLPLFESCNHSIIQLSDFPRKNIHSDLKSQAKPHQTTCPASYESVVLGFHFNIGSSEQQTLYWSDTNSICVSDYSVSGIHTSYLMKASFSYQLDEVLFTHSWFAWH